MKTTTSVVQAQLPASALLAAVGLALACLCYSPNVARADEGFPLSLGGTAGSLHGVSLLSDSPNALPDAIQVAMLGEIADEMDLSLESFRQSLDAAAVGGGDGGGSGALVFLAGLLGFIPGFGLGYLVSAHIGGFVVFLVIDLVLAGIFFGVFPVLAFAFWYLPGIIVFVVERIVEAVLSAMAATSPVYAEAPLPASESLPGKVAFAVFRF
jgi:ABC-type multidrug transport system fused ATPase/permease subunit